MVPPSFFADTYVAGLAESHPLLARFRTLQNQIPTLTCCIPISPLHFQNLQHKFQHFEPRSHSRIMSPPFPLTSSPEVPPENDKGAAVPHRSVFDEGFRERRVDEVRGSAIAGPTK